MKPKGNIKNTDRLVANGVQFLNGEICKRHGKVPCILLDYETSKEARQYAQGERFALWFKLENAEFKEVQKQLRGDLRELTIWLDEENKEKLRKFLNEEVNDDKGKDIA